MPPFWYWLMWLPETRPVAVPVEKKAR